MFVYRTYLHCVITARPKKIFTVMYILINLHVKVNMHDVQFFNIEYSSTWRIVFSNHFSNLVSTELNNLNENGC